MFIGFIDGCLLEYSFEKLKFCFDYGKIMEEYIATMAITDDKKMLYVSDEAGGIKEVDCVNRNVSYDFGEVQPDSGRRF